MKTYYLLVLSGLLASASIAAPTKDGTIEATVGHAADDDMDVVVATAKRLADWPNVERVSGMDTTKPRADGSSSSHVEAIGIANRSDLIARADDTVREVIENLEISL